MPRIITFFDDYAKSYSPASPWNQVLSLIIVLVLQPGIPTVLACVCLASAVIVIRKRRKRAKQSVLNRG